MGVEIFKPELDAVAAVEFIHGGRTFAAGEAFPHKTLGMHPTALRGLTYAGLIRFVEPCTAPMTIAPATPGNLVAPATRPPHKHRR